MNLSVKHIGDLLHLASIIALLVQIRKKKSVLGLSYRTQEIYLVVFMSRYSAYFFLPFAGYYISLMKLCYVTLTLAVVYYMRHKTPYLLTYNPQLDSFPHNYTIYPASIVLTLLFHVTFTGHEIYQYAWSFSVILEAFALVPQIYLMNRVQGVEVFTGAFVTFLGLYRYFYVVHWTIQFFMKSYNVGKQVLGLEIVFGVIQTLVVADFVVKYLKSLRQVKKITIPI